MLFLSLVTGSLACGDDDDAAATGGSGGQAGSAGGSSGEGGAAGTAGAAGVGGAAAGGAGEGGSSGGSGQAGASGGGQGGQAAAIVWKALPPMAQARASHTATPLPDGRLLVTGGRLGTDQLSSAEVLSADGTAWSAVGGLLEARANHQAALLADGRVLIVGGGASTANGTAAGKDVRASCELFDPVTATFALTGPMSVARGHFGLAVLADGKILVAGGVTTGGDIVTSAEAYDPATGAWTPVAAPPASTESPAVTRLKSGAFAFTGGLTASGISTSASSFDGQSWAALPALSSPRYRHAAAVLPSGSLMVMAGLIGNGLFASDAIALAPGATSWKKLAPLESVDPDGLSPAGGTGAAALTLPGGRVIVTGSYGPTGAAFGPSGYTAFYDEASDTWSSAGTLVSPHGLHSMTRLPGGHIVLAGGYGKNNLESKLAEMTTAPVE